MPCSGPEYVFSSVLLILWYISNVRFADVDKILDYNYQQSRTVIRTRLMKLQTAELRPFYHEDLKNLTRSFI